MYAGSSDGGWRGLVGWMKTPASYVTLAILSIVTLGKHQVSHDLKPVVTIHYGAQHSFPLDMTLSIMGSFKGIELTWGGGGEIIAVGLGHCDLSVQLLLDGKEAGTEKTIKDWKRPGSHAFEPGLPII